MAILMDLPQGSNYLIQGEEVASTGTPHLQGYVQFLKMTKKCSAILSLTQKVSGWRNYYHVLSCKGSDDDNIKYCSKDGNYTEFGTRVSINRKQKPLKVINISDDVEAEEIIEFHKHLESIGERETPPYSKDSYTDYLYEFWSFDPDMIDQRNNCTRNVQLINKMYCFVNFLEKYYSKFPNGQAPMPQIEFYENPTFFRKYVMG